MKTLMIATLMISPNLSTLDVGGGPYFVAAGQFDYGNTITNVKVGGKNPTNYSFVGAGISHGGAKFGAIANDRSEPQYSTPVQGYVGYDYPVSESVNVSYRQVINCADACGYNGVIDDIGVSAVSLSITF